MDAKLCGMHMMDSCRIEKGFRHFGHDITCEDHVLEAGLGFAVKTDKAEFIGRDAVLRKKDVGLDARIVQFKLIDPEPLLYHNEPILLDGYCSSFNGRFRDELRNGEIFYSLWEALIIIEEWRKHYNTKRSLSALGYRPPAPEAIVNMDQKPIMHQQLTWPSKMGLLIKLNS